MASLLSVVIFSVCTGIGFAGYIPVTDPATATTLVGSIVGGTLPFITIVLAINQLVLSQEIGWPDDLQDRFEGMVSFRRQVETVTDSGISPASPADFLQVIVDAVVEHAKAFRSAVDQGEDTQLVALTEELVDAVESEGRLVRDALEGADFGTFNALSSVLGHFNGVHLYTARTIRAEHVNELTDDAPDELDVLIKLLSHLAVARQTFKTLYSCIEYWRERYD